MFSSPVQSVLLVLAFVASATLAYPTDDQTVEQVITVDDISKFKDLPEGAELIPLSQERDTRGSTRYNFGKRASNDILFTNDFDYLSWVSPQFVQVRCESPTFGNGAVITHVQIDVNQSSNSGRAYITSGGIGQRRIAIIIEAYNTFHLNYSCKIYGTL